MATASSSRGVQFQATSPNLYHHDAQLARRLQDEEYAARAQFDVDHQIALELAGGAPQANTNRGLLHNHHRVHDRVVQPGVRIAEPAPRQERPAQDNTAGVANVQAERGTENRNSWGLWFVSAVASLFTGSADTSNAQDHNRQNRPTGHTCVICQDAIHGTEIRAPCGHHYDRDCIIDLFQSSTRDESLFPPKCCRQPIPLEMVRALLTPAVLELFAERQAELGTLKRVYCATPRCSRFLGPQQERSGLAWLVQTQMYTCEPPKGCGMRTCARCKAEVRGVAALHTCSAENDGPADVLALARGQGWARCPGCAQMIELNMGCYHMTCRCRTEFCYLCRARWKTCRCPQWDERRLMTAAEDRVQRQFGIQRPPAQAEAPPQAGRLEEDAGRLRAAQAARARAILQARQRALPQVAEQPEAQQPHDAARAAVLRRAEEYREAQAARARALEEARERAVRLRDAHQPEYRVVTQDGGITVQPVERPSAPTPLHAARPSSTFFALPVAREDHANGARNRRAGGDVTAAAHPFGRQKSANATSRRPTLYAEVAVAGTPLATNQTPTSASRLSSPGASASTSQSWRSSLVASPTSSANTTPMSPTPSSSRRTLDHDRYNSVQARPKSSSTADLDCWRRLVNEAMDDLRVNHECTHQTWRYRSGGGRCQTCHHMLPIYLLRCQGCELLACRRCRHNRL